MAACGRDDGRGRDVTNRQLREMLAKYPEDIEVMVGLENDPMAGRIDALCVLADQPEAPKVIILLHTAVDVRDVVGWSDDESN